MLNIKRLRASTVVPLAFLLTACVGAGSTLSISTTAPPAGVALPKTGQTTCFDASGVAIACRGTGQDGELQIGVADPNPRFVIDATGNCVTDNLTGLMWTRNANLPVGAGAADVGARIWQPALDYANNLTLCGFTDWRLPNRKELRSLINYNTVDNATALNSLGFNNVQMGSYWSSSSYVGGPTDAWTVNMGDGYVSGEDKSFGYYVWPVRAGP